MIPSSAKWIPGQLKRQTTASSSPFSIKIDTAVVRSCSSTLHYKGIKHPKWSYSSRKSVEYMLNLLYRPEQNKQGPMDNQSYTAFLHSLIRHCEDLVKHPRILHP